MPRKSKTHLGDNLAELPPGLELTIGEFEQRLAKSFAKELGIEPVDVQVRLTDTKARKNTKLKNLVLKSKT